MKTKKTFRVLLIFFVTITLAWMLLQPNQGETQAAESKPAQSEGNADSALQPSSSVLPDRVIVYYFYTSFRCSRCRKFENYTREAVQSGFAQELRGGRVEFQTLNIEEPANTHFVQDYQLVTKSVVIVDIKDGKQAQWSNLNQIWELVGNRDAFIKYIQDGINLYLREK